MFLKNAGSANEKLMRRSALLLKNINFQTVKDQQG